LPIEEKIEIIAKEIYGADGIEIQDLARQQIDRYKKQVQHSKLLTFSVCCRSRWKSEIEKDFAISS